MATLCDNYTNMTCGTRRQVIESSKGTCKGRDKELDQETQKWAERRRMTKSKYTAVRDK
jgi:hypothetical protein